MIRVAAAADEAEVVRIVQVAYAPFTELIGRRPAPMDDDYAALIANDCVWVATDEDGVIGVIVMWSKDDHLYVDNIAVLPDRHGEGIGAALLHHADQMARSLGLGEIRLYTNEVMTQNIEYYPRRGFTETHRAEDRGYRRVFFTRTLHPLSATAEGSAAGDPPADPPDRSGR